MGDEKHELDIKPDELLAEVRALRTLVEAIVLQLPDMAMRIAVGEIRRHADHAQRRVQETQNDRWRDYAATAYELAEDLSAAADMHLQERDAGARFRTIQEVPLPPEEVAIRERFRQMETDDDQDTSRA